MPDLENREKELRRNFTKMCAAFAERASHEVNKDVVIALSSEPGEGKSATSVDMALEIVGKAHFSLKENMLFKPNNEEIMAKVRDPKIKIIILDEAIRVLYKLNWQDKDQQKLNVFFDVCRQENKIIILNIPRFRDLNEKFRNDRVTYHIHIFQRGYAMVFYKDKRWELMDPWHVDETKKITDKFMKRSGWTIKDDNAEAIYGRTPGFRYMIRVYDFPPGLKEEYDATKKALSYDELEGGKSGFTRGEEDRMRAVIALIRGMNLFKAKTGEPWTKLCRSLNLKQETFKNWREEAARYDIGQPLIRGGIIRERKTQKNHSVLNSSPHNTYYADKDEVKDNKEPEDKDKDEEVEPGYGTDNK